MVVVVAFHEHILQGLECAPELEVVALPWVTVMHTHALKSPHGFIFLRHETEQKDGYECTGQFFLELPVIRHGTHSDDRFGEVGVRRKHESRVAI